MPRNTQPPSPNTNPTTELAKQRNQAAAERTLLAWIQNSLMLLGIGFTLDYIVISLRQSTPSAVKADPQSLFDSLSLLIVPLGLCLLTLAVWQYRLSIRSVQRQAGALPQNQSMATVAAIAVILFGALSAVIVLFRSV
ncbi:MAG: YidH family protein [Elainellaceae cyanobacterium]